MNLVEPIRDKSDIEAMKVELRSKSERNYILFLLGINTGFRISDICNLKVGNIKSGRIVVREGKTRKHREVLITSKLKKDLYKYIDGKAQYEYLFQSRKGKNKPIGRQRAYEILKEAAEECGIDFVGTHTLRKTYGYHHYRKHGQLVVLMQEFNHASPDITLRYIGIQQEDKDNLMRDFGL
ncbi:tyrosine-type recombinase/integrase [Aerococcaceae bacterium NML160702]|nr:tyrosine-type recombinase/integrase [Aerococcaceae bacterium NML190073]MCW6681530.1 tyrosine-type recombinase/integrase [Aerococcaceae bacterium NML160702]